jgi:spore coat protein CotH
MERLDATRLKIDKKDTMAMIFNDPPIFMQDSIFFKKENKNWYEQKYPSRKKHNKYQYLNEFKNFLFNSPDSLFGDEHEGVSKWIDINNVIDWHILLLFSNNSDGIMKNFFLYKKDKDTPFRIAIWDCDHSFGRDCDNELNMMERELDCNRSVLLRRLMLINPDAYKQKLCNRWNELRDNGILTEKNFNNMISANYEIIENYIDRNFEKYPVNGKYYFDDNNFEQEIELMRKYVEMRIPYLDKYFRELAGN